MTEIIASIIVGVALLFGCAILERHINNSQQEKCEKIGGQFYRAIDSANSLCKMPTNKG
jgi:hypothetical protein